MRRGLRFARPRPPSNPPSRSPRRRTFPPPGPPPPQIPEAPPISNYTPNVPTKETGEPFVEPARSAPNGLNARHFFGPYRRAKVPPLFPGDGARLQSLVRDGKLYLSAHDAIALAIENNLDVEVERYNLILADTDYRRAQGGGNLRGIDFTIEEPPNGVGGPGSPLLDSTAQSTNPVTPTVTDLTSLNATAQTQTNLSASPAASTQYSTGPQVPLFDPNVFLESGYLRRSDTTSLTSHRWAAPGRPGTGTTGTTGSTTSPVPYDFITANLSYLEGFRYGTQLEATVNNDSQVIYGTRSGLDPFSRPSTSVTVTQPLLRGLRLPRQPSLYPYRERESQDFAPALRAAGAGNGLRRVAHLLRPGVARRECRGETGGADRREEAAVGRSGAGGGRHAGADRTAVRADALVSSSQFDLTQAARALSHAGSDPA